MRQFYLKVALALLVVAMPVCQIGAQTRNIRIDSLSFLLDRATVQSAYIYAADMGTNYYVDDNHLSTDWTSAVSLVSSLTESTMLQPGIEGTYVAMVDEATYSHSFILFRDSRGVCYVVGNTTHADQGVFGPIEMFATPGDVQGPVVPLMGMKATCQDQQGFRYSTFAMANQLVADADTVSLLDTVRTPSAITITKSIAVMQDGHPFMATTSDPNSITVAENAQVSWVGNGTDSLKAATNIFYLHGGSTLDLKGVYAESQANIVQVADSAMLMADNAHFKTPTDKDAVQLQAKANAQVNDVTFEQSRNGVAFVNTSTGTLTIKTATVQNLMSGCTGKAVTGRAYTVSADNRIYRRTVKLVSTNMAQGDTLYLGSKLASTITDTLAGSVVLDLTGDSILGTLVTEGTDTMWVVNGVVNTLVGSQEGNGCVVVDLDSVGSLQSGSHPMTLQSGKFDNVDASADVEVMGGYYNTISGNASLKGGYFANRYDNLLAPRHAMVANTDADAATYPWMVLPGYAVHYMNHDAEGGDTIIVYNTPNNIINPRYNGTHAGSTDTVLLNWYTDPSLDAQYLWSFVQSAPSVLTSDTTLYPRWLIRGSATQQAWKVRYWYRELDDSYALSDSIQGFTEPGNQLEIIPLSVSGFHFVGDTIRIDSFAAANGSDTTFDYYFDRDTLVVRWFLDGGTLATEPDSVFLFGQPITYPADPVRPGHTFSNWHPAYTTMPAYTFICTAVYTSYVSSVVWTGDAAQTYTAQPAVLSATVSDQGNDYPATLTYVLDGQSVGEAVKAGNYVVTASVDTPDLTLDPATTQFNLTINPATLTATGTTADKRKTFDGTDTAHVTNPGTISPLGTDDVLLQTVARYDDATAGTNKSIVAYYTLTGSDMANYTLDPATETLYTDAEILPRIDIDEDFLGSDNGFDIDATGYCGGDNAGIVYHLVAGTPVDYKLTFSATDIDEQGFADVDWTAIATPGQIDIVVPAGAAAGSYTVQLKLRNELGDSTAAIPVTFSVKLNKDFARPLFSDVIAVVDTCNCLGGIQWYEDGVLIPGATGYYYQPADHDLSGHTYHFTAYHRLPDGTIQTATSCEQNDISTYVEEQSATVSVFPNPTADMATVSIEHSRTTSHTLCLYNAMGVMLQRATFEGNEATVSLSGLVQGTYTLSVDGNPVRVIKK